MLSYLNGAVHGGWVWSAELSQLGDVHAPVCSEGQRDAGPSRKVSEQHRVIYWLEQKKKKRKVPKDHHASLSAAGNAAISVIHF